MQERGLNLPCSVRATAHTQSKGIRQLVFRRFKVWGVHLRHNDSVFEYVVSRRKAAGHGREA
ncbi:hypothetical protein SCLCIDRAFT_1218750 [Scleroderma citrinum Foug A]|uniref:Uncharacterized protein n=1 Tax=Scleroderma citrinum Foug A TaxID=1036808 RepID=A0A0C3DCD2_9AGAM|nr:hypothetical protein SCLCIDRAFT_1218750 [Scleroderma citrinum Foug A]